MCASYVEVSLMFIADSGAALEITDISYTVDPTSGAITLTTNAEAASTITVRIVFP